jgi:16S rRNA (cytidine1402-2'-O)-methyltransferase
LVATPIGNLADWSPRAQAVISGVDTVLAEDTRVTGLLCHNAGLKVRLESFHAHNQGQRIPALIERLANGEKMALFSDRGMPAISDPGQELVEAVWQAGLAVSVIPGASAVVAAYAASGFRAPFAFWGFLPRSRKERLPVLESLKAWPHTSVIYEAPHHMDETLTDLAALLDDREVLLAREMTKLHEEFWRGAIKDLALSGRGWRGECVLVVGPKKIPGSDPVDWDQLVSRVEELVSQGLHPNEAIRHVAHDAHVPRRDLYQRIHIS